MAQFVKSRQSRSGKLCCVELRNGKLRQSWLVAFGYVVVYVCHG